MNKNLPDVFVQNDKATATVSTAEISRQGGGTDMSPILSVYLWSIAGGRTDVVKCFITLFKIEKPV